MANQYKNKVVYYGETLMDISEDTVAASNLLSGYTAHDKSGAPITGSVTVVTYRTGAGAPSNSLGEDGDIYLQTS